MGKTILEAFRLLLQKGKQICVRTTPRAMAYWAKVKKVAVFIIAWAIAYDDASAALHDIMLLPIEPIAAVAIQDGQATNGGWFSPMGTFFMEGIVPCVVRHFANDLLSALAFVVACVHTIKHTWSSGAFVSNMIKMVWLAIQKWIDYAK